MNEPLPNDTEKEPAAAPAKADPETLVLRAQPARIIRFKRSVVAVLAASAVSGVVLAAWFALQPPSLQILAEAEELGEPAKAPADALADLPGSYADAPQLGPPLPGDLGRAIAAQQRSLEDPDAGSLADEQRRAEQAERDRIAAELRSARQSSLLVQTAGPGRAQPAREPDGMQEEIPAQLISAPEPHAASPGSANAADFNATPGSGADVGANRIRPAPSRYLLSAGSVIPASLITGLRSDLPGLVIAQVTERVYDSPTGQVLLVPQGARLIGRYDDRVAFGQRRALIVWQRIFFPDGSSLDLENMPASDAAGYAGLEDKVDFHTGTLIQGAAISTLLGIGANVTFAGENDLVQALRESAQQNVSRAGDQLISRELQIRPTITIRPGAPVRLIVHRDLILAPPAE